MEDRERFFEEMLVEVRSLGAHYSDVQALRIYSRLDRMDPGREDARTRVVMGELERVVCEQYGVGGHDREH